MPKRAAFILGVVLLLGALIVPLAYYQAQPDNMGNVQSAAPQPEVTAGTGAVVSGSGAGAPDEEARADQTGVQGKGRVDAAEKTGEDARERVENEGDELLPAGVPAAANQAEEGTEATAPALGGSDEPAAAGCEVMVYVVGTNGQVLFGPAKVLVKKDNKWGLTPVGALDATGLEYRMSPVYYNLVLSIAGLANKGPCGWMYKVNDGVPMRAANETDIKPGDRIVWWYSEDLNSNGPTF